MAEPAARLAAAIDLRQGPATVKRACWCGSG